jgi:hypothetical protein
VDDYILFLVGSWGLLAAVAVGATVAMAIVARCLFALMGGPDPDAPTTPRRRMWYRLLGAGVVALFAAIQWYWWQDYHAIPVQRTLGWEPPRALGPLCFLANTRTDDDWIGIVLLILLVPAVLAFPCWPSRATAIITVLAIFTWTAVGVPKGGMP